jgi:ascorbate-specific PTS system EIIC-type component UlaA
MDMNQAAVFLAGSILTVLGFIVIFAGAVVINNLLHKFWKPVKFWQFDSYPPSVINVTTDQDQKRS